MKQLTFLVSMIPAIYIISAPTIAQNEINNNSFSLVVAKSGCCKVRKTTQHPWAKSRKNFDQCEEGNNREGDIIYKSTGIYWWDRSC